MFSSSSLQLKISPILDGQALLYSFVDRPEVHVGVSVAGGNSSLSLSDLPGVATWLVSSDRASLARRCRYLCGNQADLENLVKASLQGVSGGANKLTIRRRLSLKDNRIAL